MATLPPIRVISLRRATDRRRFVERVFADAGLEVEIVEAVDARAFTAEERSLVSAARTAYEYGKPMSPGMLACALSHLRVWQQMISDGLDEVIVFEDDTRPLASFRTVLEERASLPSDWDVVTFHSLFDWAGPTPIGIRVGGHDICTFRRTPMGTQAYLLRRGGAEKLTRLVPPVFLPADEILFRNAPAGLTVYGIDPAPVVEEAFPSELHATPVLGQPGVVDRIVFGTLSVAGRARRRLEVGTWRRRS